MVTWFDYGTHLFFLKQQKYNYSKRNASIIGNLCYLTDCTRINIAYAIGVLSTFTTKPRRDH